jgi:thiol-disulfide isomerase/thioredoxin
MIHFRDKFESALEYHSFLEAYASPPDRGRWDDLFARFQLSTRQREILQGFVREMNVLCLAGAWCGDCVHQCPILEHFARANSKVRLRFIDRDSDPELARELQVCGGSRVPVVVFLSEDFTECGRYGDRTLTRYRTLAQELRPDQGAVGMVMPAISLEEVADDWLREFERVQLMLRLSPRLRRLHND